MGPENTRQGAKFVGDLWTNTILPLSDKLINFSRNYLAGKINICMVRIFIVNDA
jgi:hypothetical protein